jgi:hypothetical protein
MKQLSLIKQVVISMKRLLNVILADLLFVLAFIGSVCAAENGGYSNPKALVSPAQLETMIVDNSVKVIDVRGSAKYELGHIIGALDIGVSTLDIEKNGVAMMLPGAEKFTEIMSKLAS